MIIYNPQDLTPVLAAMRNDLKSDLDALAVTVQGQNDALSQSVAMSNQNVVESIDALTVVNGEISTEVQAINTHTTEAVESLKPKEKVFDFIESVSGSVNFDSNEEGAKVAIDVQGGGLISGISGSSRISTEVEIDGVVVDYGYIAYMISKGGIRFYQSAKVTFSRGRSQYGESAGANVFLGNYVWKS